MLALTLSQYSMRTEVYNLLSILDNNYIIGFSTIIYIFSLQTDYHMQRNFL